MTTKKMDYDEFKTFYKDNYLHAFNLALRFLRDDEASRDVVADAFESIWKQVSADDKGRSANTSYLLTTVRNACLDHLRKRKIRDSYAELMLMQSERLADSQQVVMEHDQRVAMVMEALDELTPRTRQILEACYIERKKYKEAAELFQCSESAIKKHLHKAVSFLRQKFKEDF
ncbi:MAG: RNA polymerase sigma factor [Prevotella sp.]